MIGEENRKLDRVWDSTDPHPVKHQILVVSAEGMPDETFALHIRVRHPELDVKSDERFLKGYHAQSHRLIPKMLNHVHEAAIAELPDAELEQEHADSECG